MLSRFQSVIVRLAGLVFLAVFVSSCSSGPDDSAVFDWMVTDGMKRNDLESVKITSSSATGRGSFRLTFEGEATMVEDAVERLNPFVWANLCGINDPENYELPPATVYELRAEAGVFQYEGSATAFRDDDDEWRFTAYKTVLIDANGDPIWGEPRSSMVDGAVVVETPEFDLLCDQAAKSNT